MPINGAILVRSEESARRNIAIAVKAEQSGGTRITENPLYSLGVDILMEFGWDVDRIQALTLEVMRDE